MIEKMIRDKKIRLVTNRKRMMDEGGEDAGVRLIEWVRSHPDLDKLEIGLFCGMDRQVMGMGGESKLLLVTDNASEILNFMTFKTTVWPKK